MNSLLIISCLDEQIVGGITNTDGRAREKADKAREIKGKILNVHFLLLLSGLADLYGSYK
jgi:hypothetical protein